jgi:hypothetical protein
MKKLMFCLLLACFSLTLAMAQEDASGSKDTSGTRTVTGCLQKGDQANHFQLKGKDGSSWDLTSANVSLADHVGHTVSVTGTVANAPAHSVKEGTKSMAHAAGVTKDNSETGELKVSDVQMVSESCSQ